MEPKAFYPVTVDLGWEDSRRHRVSKSTEVQKTWLFEDEEKESGPALAETKEQSLGMLENPKEKRDQI